MRNPTREDLQVLHELFTPIYPQRPGLIATGYARLQKGNTASGILSDLGLAAIPITLGVQVDSPLTGTLAAIPILSYFKCVVSRNIWDNHGYKPQTLIQMIISSMQDHTPNELLYRAYEKSPLEYPLTDFQYLFAEHLIGNSQNAVETGKIQLISPDKNYPKFPYTALAVPHPNTPNQFIINPNPALINLENGQEPTYEPTMGQVTRVIQEVARGYLVNYYTSVSSR